MYVFFTGSLNVSQNRRKFPESTGRVLTGHLYQSHCSKCSCWSCNRSGQGGIPGKLSILIPFLLPFFLHFWLLPYPFYFSRDEVHCLYKQLPLLCLWWLYPALHIMPLPPRDCEILHIYVHKIYIFRHKKTDLL